MDPVRAAAKRILAAKEECVKDGNVPLYCYSSEDDQLLVAQAVAERPPLYEFKVKDNVHVQHPAIEQGATYKGMCLGRVFRLAYPFGWQHFYCDKSCCDQTGKRDEETGEPLGRHHVACTTDYTFVDLYHCIDCGRFGTITVEGKTPDEPNWPHQAVSP